MKTLYVDQTGQLGGGELALLPWLLAHPKDMQVVLFEDGPFRPLLEAGGVPVEIMSLDALKGVRRESKYLPILTALPALVSLRSRLARRAASFDVLYANSMKAFLLAALVKRRKQSLVWHLRDILNSQHFSSLLRKIVVFVGNRFATRIIVNSHATAEAFIAAGGLQSKVRVVHDGVSPIPFDSILSADVTALRDQLGCNNHPSIGVFGRLTPWKGQHILLEALSKIPAAQVFLVGAALFGEDAYAETLKERASQPDLAGRVHFLGFRREIPQLMKSMDIIAHTSTSPEPFGLVIVEGMLAQKPVIATRAGGAMEIVEDGESGILVTPASVVELREAIEKLLASSDMATRIAQVGRRRAEEVFSLEALFRGISGVLAELQPSHEERSTARS